MRNVRVDICVGQMKDKSETMLMEYMTCMDGALALINVPNERT